MGGSARRECLDWLTVGGWHHLEQALDAAACTVSPSYAATCVATRAAPAVTWRPLVDRSVDELNPDGR